MKVLIVKISSMGDLIHTLPALSDAAQHYPHIIFDWVSDQHFAEIPSWHSHVRHVIVSAHREWKKHPLQALKTHAIQNFLRELRKTKYDCIIDAQGSLKSAIVTGLAKGPRAGMDRHSVREKGASLVYQHTFPIPRAEHAITRIRKLFAGALHYPICNGPAHFGIQHQSLVLPDCHMPSPYVVFIPHTTWKSKRYPEAHWKTLIAHATSHYSIVIPWGNTEEKNLALRLAQDQPHVTVLPRLKLSEIGSLISKSEGVIGGDTGLNHLAAALQIPTLSLYGPTNPMRVAISGEKQDHMQATLSCVPCYKRHCYYKGSRHAEAACLMALDPRDVWKKWMEMKSCENYYFRSGSSGGLTSGNPHRGVS